MLMDGRRSDWYTISSPMSFRFRLAIKGMNTLGSLELQITQTRHRLSISDEKMSKFNTHQK